MIKKIKKKHKIIVMGVIGVVVIFFVVKPIIQMSLLKNSIKNEIVTYIKASPLNSYITKKSMDGYMNSHVTIYVNNGFDKLDYSDMVIYLGQLESQIENRVMSVISNSDDLGMLWESETIDIISSKGKYTFNTNRYGHLKLPNGTNIGDDGKEITNTAITNTPTVTTTDNSNVTNTPKEPSKDDQISVWVEAEDIVKNNLKSPSTAKFPFSFSDGDITEIADNTFKVTSYVDSENSFGAKIRSNFSITILKSGDKYTYKDLSIENN